MWYTRFDMYLSRGPGRSLLGAYNQWRIDNHKKPSTGVPIHWQNAMKKWHWRERADAWDLAQVEERRRADEQKWRERRDEVKEKDWDLGAKLRERAAQMLMFPVARTVVTSYDDGRPQQVIEPADWRPADIARYVEVAVKLQRLAAEMETERKKVGVALDDVIAGLPDGYREAVRAALADAIPEE